MKPIVCRVHPRIWWGAVAALFGFGVMMAGSLLDPSIVGNPTPRYFIWPFCALILWAAVYLVGGVTRGQVRADEQGLRWRGGFSRWRSVRWEEISDFYVGLISGHTVETPAGKLGLDNSYLGIDAIIALVPERAVNARARTWDAKEYRRDEDWEQTLSLWSKSQKWTAFWRTAAALYIFVYFSYESLFGARKIRPSTALVQQLQWFDVAAIVIVVSLFCLVMFVSIWPLISTFRERKFAWAHRDETLRLNARGLTFASDEKTIEAAWSELQNIEPLENQNKFKSYRVVTAQGEFVLWALTNSHMFERFRSRCENYAPDAVKQLQAEAAAQSLNSELNPPPNVVEGSQTFTFRTRGNRLILLCAGGALGMVPIFYLVTVFNRTDVELFPPSWPLFWTICAFSMLAWSALYLWFARTRIVADARGLTLVSPFRRPRFLAWNEIAGAGADAWGDWVRVSGRKTYWARWLVPARRAELRALIESRRR